MIVQEIIDNFNHTHSSRLRTNDSEYRTMLPSGSTIFRKIGKGKTIHQLFLNEKEYETIKLKYGDNRHVHFYGGNYIYLNEYLYVRPFIKTLLEV